MGLSTACTKNDTRTADNRTTDDTAGTSALGASPSPYAPPAADEKITAGDVAANPTKYVGQRVTVQGDVADILGTNSFTLDEDRLTADQNLLVLSQGGVPALDQKNEKVMVSGKVQMFEATEVKREHAWFDATPEIEVKYKNRPVIIADSVRTADGRELTGAGALPAGSGEVGHGNTPADSNRSNRSDRP
jgi:hypothetical protein